MKNILIALLLFTESIFAQQDKRPELMLSLSYKSLNSSAVSLLSNLEDKLGLITGYLVARNDKAVSVANYQSFDFFNELPEIYWYHKSNPSENISEEKRLQLYQKKYPASDDNLIIHFEMYPGDYKVSDKELQCYFKYAVYKKTKKINDFKYNYDISFHDKFISLPVNKKHRINIFDEFMPGSEITVELLIDQPASPNTENNNTHNEIMEADDLKMWLTDIAKFMNDHRTVDTNLKLGLEYLRTDKSGSEVLVRKLEYPLAASKTISTDNEIIKLKSTLYKGTISTPLVIYNKDKEKLFEKSTHKDAQNNFVVYAVLTDYKNNKFLLHLFVGHIVSNTSGWYKEEIELSPGHKYKLALKNFYPEFEEIIEDERFKIDAKEDYYKYVSDYLILSLEK